MRSPEPALSSDERVVRRYECMSADRTVTIAGTVLPLPGAREGEGVVTLTNRRLMFDAEAGVRADGSPRSRVHEEVRLSDVTSVSTCITRAGRGLALPLVLLALGLALMLLPFASASSDGSFDLDGDYEDGYNDGIESGYYDGFLAVVQSGGTAQDIPYGYHSDGRRADSTAEYDAGYDASYRLGVDRGTSDARSGAVFSVPTGLMIHHEVWGGILVLAVAGAVVFVLGSVVYSLSGVTSEWAVLRLGPAGRGIHITSFKGGWSAGNDRGLRPSEGYAEMVSDLGSAVMEARSGKGPGAVIEVVDDHADACSAGGTGIREVLRWTVAR